MANLVVHEYKNERTVHMDSVTNKGAIIVAVIGAIATIISACISVSLQKENVVLVNDNTAMQDTISALESRIFQLEQAKSKSVDNTDEIARLKSDNEKLTATVEALQNALNNQPTTSNSANSETDMTEKRDFSQSVGIHTLLDAHFKDYGTVLDNRGNTHKHSINHKDSGYSRWNDYSHDYFLPVDLDYQYKELSGMLFQNAYYSDSPENTTLTITSRDRVLWEGKVNGSSEALTFEVDTTGLSGIAFHIDNAATIDQPPAFFEAYLWK